MGTLFSFMYSSTANDEACDDKTCETTGIYEGCLFQKSAQIGSCETTQYSVQNKFEAIFEFGIFTYFADAIFRFIVVLGLKYNQLWVQIAGIVLTVIVSTFLQTTLMILMPIYRYNTAGIQICEKDVLDTPCNAFVYITVLVSLVWVASCCTSFAFNKNDYSKEFGYSTRAVAEEHDSASDMTGSPPQQHL